MTSSSLAPAKGKFEGDRPRRPAGTEDHRRAAERRDAGSLEGLEEPAPVGIVADERPEGSATTVLTAPHRSADGANRSSNGITATLCGIVMLSPAKRRARATSTAAGSPSTGTRKSTYRQSRPSASKAAFCISEVGFPRRDLRRGPRSGSPLESDPVIGAHRARNVAALAQLGDGRMHQPGATSGDTAARSRVSCASSMCASIAALASRGRPASTAA